MLSIRQAQMDAFRDDYLRQFERRMVREIAQAFPVRYAALGDDGALRLIRAGIRKAAKTGVSAEQAVEDLIGLMVQYGEDFDPGKSAPRKH